MTHKVLKNVGIQQAINIFGRSRAPYQVNNEEMIQYLIKKYTIQNPESPSSPSKFESDLDDSESDSKSVQSLTLSESSDTSDEDLSKSLDVHEFHMYIEHCKKECANICSKRRK